MEDIIKIYVKGIILASVEQISILVVKCRDTVDMVMYPSRYIPEDNNLHFFYQRIADISINFMFSFWQTRKAME
jgi:hypothetical protein